MATFRVVKHFDVVKHIGPSVFPSCVRFALDSFALKQLEKTLGDGVIVAVPTPTHALLQIVGLAEIPPVIAAELTALIGMHHHRFSRLPTPHCAINQALIASSRSIRGPIDQPTT